MKSGVLPGNKRHSAKEVFDAIKQRGGTADQAVTGVAIAFRESRFNDKAYCINYNNRGTDRGIFQLNSIAFASVPDSQAYDFDGNLDGAKAGSKNWTDWGPWRGVPSDTERKNAASLINGGPSGNNIIGNPSAGALRVPVISDLTDFLKSLAVIFDPAWWLRVGQILLGVLALGTGVYMIGREYAPRNLDIRMTK